MEANRARGLGACFVLVSLCGCEAGNPAGPGHPQAEAEAPEEDTSTVDSEPAPSPDEAFEVTYPGVPPAVSGGTLALSADGRYAVAADSDRDQIHVIDVNGGQVRSVSVLRGSEPGRVALDASGRAHVVLRGAGKLVRLSLAGATIEEET